MLPDSQVSDLIFCRLVSSPIRCVGARNCKVLGPTLAYIELDTGMSGPTLAYRDLGTSLPPDGLTVTYSRGGARIFERGGGVHILGLQAKKRGSRMGSNFGPNGTFWTKKGGPAPMPPPRGPDPAMPRECTAVMFCIPVSTRRRLRTLSDPKPNRPISF